jgi:hypothetical protein
MANFVGWFSRLRIRRLSVSFEQALEKTQVVRLLADAKNLHTIF